MDISIIYILQNKYDGMIIFFLRVFEFMYVEYRTMIDGEINDTTLLNVSI